MPSVPSDTGDSLSARNGFLSCRSSLSVLLVGGDGLSGCYQLSCRTTAGRCEGGPWGVDVWEDLEKMEVLSVLVPGSGA